MIVHPEAVAEAEVADGRLKIGYSAYHTLVMPQLDFVPLSVMRQLKKFEQSGGKVIWVDCVPRGAELVENDEAVKAALENAQPIPAGQLAGSIAGSYSPAFDLAFSPGTDQMMVGRFHRDGKQIYLLVNRLQKPISIEVKGEGTATLLDPSTGEITSLSLPAGVVAIHPLDPLPTHR
jgi:hypothetical protein